MTKIVRPKASASPAPASAPASASPAAAPSSEPRNRPLVPPRAPSSAKTKNKVLLSMLDGKIEWEKMSSESRKAFEEMFRDPQFLKQFGLTGRDGFDPAQMKALYDGMTMIYQTVMGMFMRWPVAALKLLAYTDEQKEMLAGPTAKLADRFAPALLRDNQELIMWGAVFFAVTQKNFMAATEELKKIEAAKKTAGPGSVPGPVRVPGPAPADRPAPHMQVPFVAPQAQQFHEGESLG